MKNFLNLNHHYEEVVRKHFILLVLSNIVFSWKKIKTHKKYLINLKYCHSHSKERYILNFKIADIKVKFFKQKAYPKEKSKVHP